MQPRHPINLQVQYARTAVHAAPEHVWDAITHAEDSAVRFFEIAEPRSARTGSPIRWHLDDRCPPLRGRIVGWERPRRLDIVIEPGDEFTPFVQVRFELTATPDGCLLTVVSDPLSDCRDVTEESAQTIAYTADALKQELEARALHGAA